MDRILIEQWLNNAHLAFHSDLNEHNIYLVEIGITIELDYRTIGSFILLFHRMEQISISNIF